MGNNQPADDADPFKYLFYTNLKFMRYSKKIYIKRQGHLKSRNRNFSMLLCKQFAWQFAKLKIHSILKAERLCEKGIFFPRGL